MMLLLVELTPFIPPLYIFFDLGLIFLSDNFTSVSFMLRMNLSPSTVPLKTVALL